MEIFSSFWPWYVTGPLIGLYVPALYLLVNRHFGISSTFRDICAAFIRPSARYFQYDWKAQRWRSCLSQQLPLEDSSRAERLRRPRRRRSLPTHSPCFFPGRQRFLFDDSG